MKILISADMEGATGVTWPADVEPGTQEWQRCRRMFTCDVNAAVAGFYDGGATEVLINEAHATMRNLLLEELDKRAIMLTGRHKELSMVEGIQKGDVDGVAFVGYHAAAGAEGVLAHTYLANSITEIRINGVRASEGLLNSYVAGEYGVPIVLVTGDDRTCAVPCSIQPWLASSSRPVARGRSARWRRWTGPASRAWRRRYWPGSLMSRPYLRRSDAGSAGHRCCRRWSNREAISRTTRSAQWSAR